MTTRSGAVLAMIASVVLVGGCSVFQGSPFDPSLVGRQMYLCCTTRFSTSFAASDANYGKYYAEQGMYAQGPILAAGTPVVVTEVRAAGVAFHTRDSSMTFRINFGYGKKVLTPAAYFAKILLPSDPTAALFASSPTVAADVQAGRLVEGMTREQTLMARGYPPAHQTPDLDANQWVYYETPGIVERVTFVNGKVSDIARGQAP